MCRAVCGMSIAIALAFPGKLLAVHRARTPGAANGRPGATRNPVTLGEGTPIVMDMGV